jgi:hypothetical protein
MKRFLVINTKDEILNKTFEVFFNEKGYTKVENPYTSGDNDILIVDTLYKKYTYGENGSTLISNYFLSKFENVDKLSGGYDISLENIIRYASKLDDCYDFSEEED